MSGVPDVLCLKNGAAVFLEVKKPGEKPTPIQMARMDEIRRVGGAPCAVVTSKDEAMTALVGGVRRAINNELNNAEKRSKSWEE